MLAQNAKNKKKYELAGSAEIKQRECLARIGKKWGWVLIPSTWVLRPKTGWVLTQEWALIRDNFMIHVYQTVMFCS